MNVGPTAEIAPTTGMWATGVLSGAALIGLASVSPASTATVASVLGIALLFAWKLGARPASMRLLGALVVVSTIGAFGSGLVRIPEITPPELLAWLVPPAAVAASMIVRPHIEHRNVVVGVLIVVVAGIGAVVMVEHAQSPVGVDVYLAHQSAAEAMSEGENPYSEAVRYPNGSPYAAEGEVLEGYAYPPVTLWAFAASTWLTGDPRWLNVALWIATLSAVACKGIRSGSAVTAAVVVVLAAAPAWRLVVFTGWTEPLTIALLAVAALTWKRSPIGSGVALGLALASKQYMVLLLPLLLLHRDDEHRPRTATAILTAGVTLIPYAVLDLGLLIDRLVLRPMSLPFRPDSQNLVAAVGGFEGGQSVLTGLALVAVLVVSWHFGRSATGQDTFLLGSAAALGIFFLLTLAFANYWFFVAALAALAVTVSAGPVDLNGGVALGRRSPENVT